MHNPSNSSPVIAHYRAYFSDGYSALKLAVTTAVDELVNRHGGEAASGFERQVRLLVERREFWSPFCEVPQIALDTASITSAWLRASELVQLALQRKQAAPLERMALCNDARSTLQAYDQARQIVAALDQDLQRANKSIALVKERTAGANVTALAADSAALKAARARHEPPVDALCDDYLTEQIAKAACEQQRDAARAALDAYRNATFPAYQSAINAYLARFNAGFRLDRVVSTNTRGGSSCTYDVVINNTPVPIGGAAPGPGNPSFRTALSAGDRNALALAFFFASLDQDRGLGHMIVAIDDPISSLDEHRALTTVNEIQRLVQRAGQVIVLSHSKPFLCRLWEGADTSARTAIQVVRDGNGSTIKVWDVHADCITEHDRRDRLLREHLRTATTNAREVAASLRPHLEAFLRVACPQHFPPGTLLGPFRGLCQQRVGTPEEILSAGDIRELEELTQYANLFHHDTNAAYHTVHISDAELTGFARRTLAFASR